jgi:hypothetical protein
MGALSGGEWEPMRFTWLYHKRIDPNHQSPTLLLFFIRLRCSPAPFFARKTAQFLLPARRKRLPRTGLPRRAAEGRMPFYHTRAARRFANRNLFLRFFHPGRKPPEPVTESANAAFRRYL